MILFAFFGPWLTLLAGAGAVAVPIVIFLLNRRRYRVVTWAAMRFLLKAQQQNIKRMRIEQLLLLLVRVGLVLAVLLAMASVTPWAERIWASIWPDAAGRRLGVSGRTHHVFVIDASLSMNLGQDGLTCFERAKQLALAKVKDAQTGDAFSILVLKENPTWLVGETSVDARKVAKELESVQPTHGNASVAAALGMIAAKLGESSRGFPNRAVYFLTDMQRATWKLAAPTAPVLADGKEKNILQEISRLARTVFVDVGREGATNRSLSDLSIDVPFVTTGYEAPIVVTLHNYGPDVKNLKLELWVGKAREGAADPSLPLQFVTQKLRDFSAGEKAAILFPHKFANPGTYAVQVRADADDLAIDDVRTVIVTVKETIPLLLVNGKNATDRYEQAAEYLRIALNPFPKGQEPKFAPLRPRVISPAQFAEMPDHELGEYDAVFLCDVPQVGPGELRRLETFLRLGGGMVVGVGDNVADNLEIYNRMLAKNDQGLLPAKLFKRVAAPAKHFFSLHVPSNDLYLTPPLRAFVDDDVRLTLRSGRFRQYLQAKAASDARVRTLLTYMPDLEPEADATLDKSLATDDPAILEWNPPLPRPEGPQAKNLHQLRYRGKVVLFTSTLNMDWNSWPGSPSYGAMMQELARVAVSGKLRDNSLVVGNLLEEPFLTGGSEIDVSLTLPDPRGPAAADAKPSAPRKVRTQAQGEVSMFRWADTDLAGLYLLSSRNDPREIPFAVNFPSSTQDQTGSESDLTRMDKAGLEESFPGWDIQIVGDPRQAATGNAVAQIEDGFEVPSIGPGIAHKLLLLVLFLQILEVILAWRFGHYSTAGGTTAQPAADGRFLPLLVTFFVLPVFALIAFILGHAAVTGDFLGFLPDGMRLTLEGWLRIPPAEAGEGSRWALEWTPYLRDAVSDPWIIGSIALSMFGLLLFIGRSEAPAVRPLYKTLLGGLRLFLILYTMVVLLPQQQLRIDRQGWPDVVLVVDDSRSMGEPDSFQDEKVQSRAKKLGESIKKQLTDHLPEKIKTLELELVGKREILAKEPGEALQQEIELLQTRLQSWQNQRTAIESASWRPTRLQLAQALIAQPGSGATGDWLSQLIYDRKTKLHTYHLDTQGRAVKLSDITEAEADQIDRAKKEIAGLEAEGKESRLGSAVRQVIDQYRGASLSAVIFLTDGVTTRDESLAQVADYAAQKGVPLFFVGIGDDHEIRDLKLHDLQVSDAVFVNDTINFEARLTGHGFKDLEVPVVLKLKDDAGNEKELTRAKVKIQPLGKSERVRLRFQAKEVGRKHFVIEVEAPKSDRPDKAIPPGNLRLERTVEVLDAKLIRVLYIEGTPRYEFRFLKSMLEREGPDDKKNRSIELKTILLDADADFAQTDRTSLPDFPATREELEQFDIVIIGDCDPRHPKLGEARLRMLADFVRGEDSKGRKTNKTGGGLLMIAGQQHGVHGWKGTPLGDVIPIEPLGKAPADTDDRVERLRLELSPIGKLHQVFRLVNDEFENQAIWQRLQPMYWFATGYRIKPLAEVLAVHPTLKAQVAEPGQDPRHPLAVQQFVGSGRTMFFGFDETWRWRFREDEVRFNDFWVQTIRYLSRTRITRTELRLDRQTAYRLGEPIKVTVRFPDNLPLPGKDPAGKEGPKLDVKVISEFRPHNKDVGEPEIQTISLEKIEGSWGTFEYKLDRTREGKYRFWLSTPDVSKQQPDGQKPAAEATVELPPGELDRLRMDQLEMAQAADATQGRFYTLASADQLLEELPTGFRVSLSTPRPPYIFWNHSLSFALVILLLTAEWVLRKRKHML